MKQHRFFEATAIILSQQGELPLCKFQKVGSQLSIGGEDAKLSKIIAPLT
jgi:hypothetical protein